MSVLSTRPQALPPFRGSVLVAFWMALISISACAGRAVPDFSLLDLRSANHDLYRVGGKAVVLFFTGNGCPIARKSSPKLHELRDKYEELGVSFWIINTYPADTLEDARKEYDELELSPLMYLRDPRQGVALALGVERTAEVVAIRTDDWRVIYQGAVDDQYVEGAENPEPRERYLDRALEEFLSGQVITRNRTQARGCRLAFVEAGKGDEVPSYTAHIAPLLNRHCVGCHREGAIMDTLPWDRHDRVKSHARMIEEVVLTRRMPPWDPAPTIGNFANANVLTREEVQLLLRWVQAGAPRGEGEDPLTAPLPPLGPWPMGNPDVVIRLPEAQQIPATGVVEYRHIRVANPFSNEVWIAGTDIKPGNRKVVHHAILYAKWPGCPDGGNGNGVFFCGWAPGTPPAQYPKGVAKRLPAGAELTLEMHYTTCGSAQSDQTEVALYRAPGTPSREVATRAATELDISIPPGTPEARHSAIHAFERPATLYSLSPHMHVRGKWMRYELLRPDASRETLLYVPRYDFKWQLTYQLEKPLHVPAGSWLLVTGAYDNSPGKSGNPNPMKHVHHGLQSWDEMFMGFFDAADEPVAPLAQR